MKRLILVSHYLPAHIKSASLEAEDFLMNGLQVIHEKKSFSYCNHTPKAIIRQLTATLDMYANFNKSILVNPLVPKYRGTSMVATTFSNKPDEIFFNALKVNTDFIRRYARRTFIHEFCHIAGFNHGTGRMANYFQGSEKKRNSVPIWLADRGDVWIEKKNLKAQLSA